MGSDEQADQKPSALAEQEPSVLEEQKPSALKEESKALVRAMVSLYAAIVGFGMQAVLTVTGPGLLHQHRWFIFVVLALFALRILSGASIHLIANHYSAFTSAPALFRDICSLFLLALCLLVTAHATTLDHVFVGLWAVSGLLIVWAVAESTVVRKGPSGKLAINFRNANIFYAGGLLVSHISYEYGLDAKWSPCGYAPSIVFLAILSVGVASWDLWKQYDVLAEMVKEAERKASIAASRAMMRKP